MFADPSGGVKITSQEKTSTTKNWSVGRTMSIDLYSYKFYDWKHELRI